MTYGADEDEEAAGGVGVQSVEEGRGLGVVVVGVHDVYKQEECVMGTSRIIKKGKTGTHAVIGTSRIIIGKRKRKTKRKDRDARS